MGRHLLTNLTSSSSPTNATSDLPCTDFCDPSCGDFDECYTFPAIPDDPLPPSPLPPPQTTIVATPSSSSHDSFQLSPLAIVVIVVLAAAFLFISYYAILIKYCSFLTRLFTRRDLTRTPHAQPNPSPGADPDHSTITSPNNNNQFVDHPIWLISTVGLHQSIINSITVIPYKKEDGLIDGTDCSVCLSEFQQGETLRLLPKCKHAFHIDCIDTWLRSHTNCPLCRAGIVANSGGPSMASNNPSFGHSRRTELSLMPDSDSSDVELGNTYPGISNSSSSNDNNVTLVVSENRSAGTGDLQAANNSHHQNKPDDYIAVLVRRSYSMDYQNAGVQPNNSNSNSSSFALMATSSSRSLPSRVTLLKRSYSWSERVFCQNDRNSAMSP